MQSVCLRGLGVFLSLKLNGGYCPPQKIKWVPMSDGEDRGDDELGIRSTELRLCSGVAPLCPMYATELIYISCGCGCCSTVAVDAAASLQHVFA